MDRYLKVIGQMLGVAVITCFFFPKLGLTIAVLTILLVIALQVDDFNLAARLARRREMAAIARRADAQHHAFQRGDTYGLYGNFPPPPSLREPRKLAVPQREDEMMAWRHAYLRRQAGNR